MINELVAEHGDIQFVSEYFGTVEISFADGYDHLMTAKEYKEVRDDVLENMWNQEV